MDLFLYYQTLKYLRFRQFRCRLVRLLSGRKLGSGHMIEAGKYTGEWKKSPPKNSSMLSANSFQFLNREGTLNDRSEWNNPNQDKLWLYNLHYFDYLHADSSPDYCLRCKWLIERWINENPPGEGNGWEPYPLSLRIVNWIKWHLCGNELSAAARVSLANQVRFLRKHLEYHLLANHLFANAKALVFAGLFFEGREADSWLKKGLSILKNEIPEQIMDDGGNFERSPMYHSIMLEDMLDLINIAKCYSHAYITEHTTKFWILKIQKMFSWLHSMCHGDGRIALFNDAAMGIAPKMSQLVEYAKKLNIAITQESQNDLIDLRNTGYVRVQKGAYVLIADAGDVGPDYQPGHAHADTLSFELSCGDHRIIVDSGTSCYGTGEERLRQRGTAAHNTVRIDKQDSSEVWGGFRVARRARITERRISDSGEFIVISATHNGYRRIKGVGEHRRVWTIQGNKIIIEDLITGSGKHFIEACFHFHPEMKISFSQDKKVVFLDEKNLQTRIYPDPNIKFAIENSTYHPEFRISIENKKLICSADVSLPFSLRTIIEM